MTEQAQSQHSSQENIETESRGSPYLPPLVGCAFIGLIVAFVIGLRLFGVISGLIFMEDAPLPEQVIEIHHENIGYGSDEWTYETELTPCEVVTFYEANESVCVLHQAVCSGSEYTSTAQPVENIATCTGTDTFSIFGLKWQTTIYTDYIALQETTHFTLRRDVLWSGLPSTAEAE